MCKRKNNNHCDIFFRPRSWPRVLLIVSCLLQSFALFANDIKVSINGKFAAAINTFEGEIEFKYSSRLRDDLLFHLPPNRNSAPDQRNAYWLHTHGKIKQEVSRADLQVLKNYYPTNMHLAKSIYIKGVFLNGHAITYQLSDNPELPPLRNSQNALLRVNLPKKHASTPFHLTIQFRTVFNSLPKGYRRLLWDYVPRPVNFIEGVWDLPDNLKSVLPIKTNIQVVSAGSQTKQVIITTFERLSIPTVLLDPWEIQNEFFHLSVEDYLLNRVDFIDERIVKILLFLYSNGWIKKSDSYKFIIWNGPLRVSGNYIVLPRDLFRYSVIFQKIFEIAILQSIVESKIRTLYLLDSRGDPWILPAIQAEIIRSYFKKIYQNDPLLFPWLNWLNPNFFQENTIKPWIRNLTEKNVINASDSLDLTYYRNIYHPWHEKGFHLLRVIFSGQQNFEDEIYPRIRSVLQSANKYQVLLSPGKFFDLFALNSFYRDRGTSWLSKEGNIDFGFEDVSFDRVENGVQVQLEIVNSGTISPVLEAEFILAENIKERRIIREGAGKYSFLFSSQPEEIILDPEHFLLEDNLLNNSWRFPLQLRPLWDFAAADRWLFTISPIIGGNVFDSNLFGLGLSFSYLEQTSLQLNFWKRGKDFGNDLSRWLQEGDTLWESSLFHKGFPFPKSKIYLQNSILQASYSRTVGITHQFIDSNTKTWLDLNIWEAELEEINEDIKASTPKEWGGVEISGGFPLIRGGFSSWGADIMARYGRNIVSANLEFGQQSLTQSLNYKLDSFDLHFGSIHGFSQGSVPLQKMYPLGGPEGLPGFPRVTDLLFGNRHIVEFGSSLPSFLTHTNINFTRLAWLSRVVPRINYHWGVGQNKDTESMQFFQDIELQLAFHGDFINMYQGFGTIAIAQPINHEKYKDFRIILLSSWVF